MCGAVITYLAFRRDEVGDERTDVLRLAARAEFDGAPPQLVRDWLESEGVQNIEAVNTCLKAASPWYSFYNVESPEALNPQAVTRV